MQTGTTLHKLEKEAKATPYFSQLTQFTRSTRTVHTSAKARLTRIWIRDQDHHQMKFSGKAGPVPTFPENFMQMHLEVFVQSC